jgi:AraC-like DNA-binding protein
MGIEYVRLTDKQHGKLAARSEVEFCRGIMATTRTIPAPFSEYLTVEEVAALLNVSHNTVTRLFEHMEGVIDLGHPEKMHKRRRRILRISRRTLDRFIAERQVQVRHRR